MHRMPPITLEDRTGINTNTDFDDMYDRIFFHVARTPGQTTTKIYEMTIRASRHRSTLPLDKEPIILLDFAPDESLGTISFLKAPSQPSISMGRYLRKTSIFGSSLSRKFFGSDGREYRWNYRSVAGQEWTCTTAENYLVAHYDLKPLDVKAYDVSGNNFIIYDSFKHLIPELVASLIIMRHISQYNL